MRAHLVVTTDDGKKYEADLDLVPAGEAARPTSAKKSRSTAVSQHGKHVEFSLNIRNFVKTHASAMSGPQRFALLIAYATKGKTDQEVELAEIAKQWNKITARLGKFNAAYPTRAKDEGYSILRSKANISSFPSGQKFLVPVEIC